jgi:hypothetical protein
MSKEFRVFLILLVVGFSLAGCGSELYSTATPQAAQAVQPIPTFTPVPATALPVPTSSPTPIVVPPTPTPAPTATPRPTATAKPAPTATPLPTAAPRPTFAQATPPGQGPYREISPEEARNLSGYRALLPTYLPAGYRLGRISFSEIPGSNIISLVAEFDAEVGQPFYLNTRYIPISPTATAPVTTPTGSPNPNQAPSPAPTLPPIRTGPFPTVASGVFRQDTVLVRGQAALLSYSLQFTSLSWSETSSSYALNGMLTPEEALKVAESLR